MTSPTNPQPDEIERFVRPESNEKLAACLERVADNHSGCFTDEDAFVLECAIAALTNTTDGGK